LDLEVGTQIVFEREPKPGHEFPIDPYNQEHMDQMFIEPIYLPVAIPSGRRALLCSAREITIPPGMKGSIEIRSTFARLGLMTPPTVIDPGFEGQITFELKNDSLWPILIYPGMKIWSLSYSVSAEPLYTGRYQRQRDIQIPRALIKDIEIR